MNAAKSTVDVIKELIETNQLQRASFKFVEHTVDINWRQKHISVANKIENIQSSLQHEGFIRSFNCCGSDVGVQSLFAERGKDSAFSVPIHRHHTLAPSERMVEYCGSYDGQEALITNVRNEREVSTAELMPNVLALTDNGYGVVEYLDPRVLIDPQYSYSALENKEVLGQIRKIISDAGLGAVLGIGLCNKAFYTKGDGGHLLLEITDTQMHANVVQWIPREDIDKSIQTLWKFGSGVSRAFPIRSDAISGLFCSDSDHGGFCDPRCRQVCAPAGPGHEEDHPPNHDGAGP